MSKICIIGLGYIGLPTAAILASNGNEIIGVDINEKARNSLMSGNPYPEEPGLHELLEKARDSGTLTVSESPKEADVFIICVPTPFTPDKKADLSYIADATKNLLPVLKKGNLIILESTVPPGTTRDVVCKAVEEAGFEVGVDVFVAFCPERMMPGKIVKELIENDRVIGGMNEKASQMAKSVYGSFSKGNLYLTDATTAEFVKLIENSFRDINIAFANELAIVSKDIGINIWEAIDLANKHPRVNIHSPGPGVGGHCIAVDPYFIIERGNGKASFLSLARRVNSHMPNYVVEEAEELIGSLSGRKIAVLGIAYKGNIGDSRESPSLDIIKLLAQKGVVCAAYDPYVEEGYIDELAGFEDAVIDAELLIIATGHSAFKELDPHEVGKLVKNKIIFDTRNLIDRERWEAAGWSVRIIGVSQ